MSKRAHKRAVKGLEARRQDYDKSGFNTKPGYTRPGSLNPRKSSGK